MSDRPAGLIQCVPNLSEGRRADILAALVDTVRRTPGVRLADWSADPDHNRLVITFVGPPAPVREAALWLAGEAVERVDLREHAGVHPRLGALDVLPFVPLSGLTLTDCADLAREVGRELAERYALPVFLYEAASPAAHRLPDIRRHAFTTLLPDYGPSAPHPTAGAAVVGARGPLIAYNVNLTAPDPSVARAIAREMRGKPEWPGLRALGLALPARGLSQVSLNLTRPDETPLLRVFRHIQTRARELGTSVIGSEIIGAVPGSVARTVLADALQAEWQPGQVLWEAEK